MVEAYSFGGKPSNWNYAYTSITAESEPSRFSWSNWDLVSGPNAWRDVRR